MEDSRLEGREEGREEGKMETAHTLIINMLKENEPIDKICRYAECDEAFVLQVKAALQK